MQMASHAGRHDAAPRDEPRNQSSSCTCLGLCCGTTHVAVVERTIDLPTRATMASASPAIVVEARRQSAGLTLGRSRTDRPPRFELTRY